MFLYRTQCLSCSYRRVFFSVTTNAMHVLFCSLLLQSSKVIKMRSFTIVLYFAVLVKNIRSFEISTAVCVLKEAPLSMCYSFIECLPLLRSN